MNISEKQIYRFDNVEVDLSRGCLLLNGQEKHLRQKAFQVLVFLLERPEKLVSKSELIETIWKDTAVTDDVLVQCIKEIRRSIGDDSHQPRYIKTIPKSGYRFIGELNKNHTHSYIEEITKVEFEIKEEFDTDPPNNPLALVATTKQQKLWNFSTQFYPVILLVLLIGLGVTAYFGWRTNPPNNEIRLPKIDGKKTIAVMFFENQSNNSELNWLCEGLTDMLITDLSRSEKLTVLSRGQLHTLLERQFSNSDKLSLEQASSIAQQTQAEYFVIGSFAKIGERMRLNVQLYDSNSSNLYISETLNVEKPEQILTEIDLLSLKISNHLKVYPNEIQNLASVMTNNLEAYRNYSLAIEKSQLLLNKEAIELLEKAVALDPEFAMAHARIGFVYSISQGRSETGKPFLEKAFKLSQRLTEKDRLNIKAWYEIANMDFPSSIKTYREIVSKYPLETEGYWRLGKLLEGEGQAEEAIEILKQGLTIDAESTTIYNLLGGIYSRLGKHAEAIAAHQRYVALAPNEANTYDSLGMSYQWSGDYLKAIENYKRALEINPNFEIALIHLANTYFQMGQYRTSEKLFNRYIEIAPTINEKVRGLVSLITISVKRKDYVAAEKIAKDYMKAIPDETWFLYWVLAEKGDLVRAKKIEETVILRNKNNERGSRTTERLNLSSHGYISFQNNKNDEAIKYYQEAVRVKAPTWNIESFEDSLGNAYLRVGRFDEAIAEFQRVLHLNPNYPLVHFNLAKAYKEKGLPEQARETFQKFLEVWKDADADIPEIITARQYVGS